MKAKDIIRKIIYATPRNRAGGVFSPKRLMAAATALVMAVVGTITPGFAADTATGTVNVIASVSGVYSLVIPQTVTLSKSNGGEGPGTYTANVPICVKGSLTSRQYVTVSVNNPTITCEDGSTTTAAFTSVPKTTWESEDVSDDGTTSNYVMSAELATPGEWSGAISVGCKLQKRTSTFTIGISEYELDEGMNWTEWVNSEYNTRGIWILYPYVLDNGTMCPLDWNVRAEDVIEVGGQYYPGGEPVLLNFSVKVRNGTKSCKSLYGVTWDSWINSQLNTLGLGYYYGEDNITDESGNVLFYYDDKAGEEIMVSPKDEIINGGEYAVHA